VCLWPPAEAHPSKCLATPRQGGLCAAAGGAGAAPPWAVTHGALGGCCDAGSTTQCIQLLGARCFVAPRLFLRTLLLCTTTSAVAKQLQLLHQLEGCVFAVLHAHVHSTAHGVEMAGLHHRAQVWHSCKHGLATESCCCCAGALCIVGSPRTVHVASIIHVNDFGCCGRACVQPEESRGMLLLLMWSLTFLSGGLCPCCLLRVE
jgi:hypothetical protein